MSDTQTERQAESDVALINELRSEARTRGEYDASLLSLAAGRLEALMRKLSDAEKRWANAVSDREIAAASESRRPLMIKPAALELVTACSCCGMGAGPPRTYHPYAACLMFQQSRSSENVRANLATVVDYGMKAQKAGVTLEQALSDFNSVLFREVS